MENLPTSVWKSSKNTKVIPQGSFILSFIPQVVPSFQHLIQNTHAISDCIYALFSRYTHINRSNNIFKYVYNN